MKINLNKKILKRLLETSIPIAIALTTLTGCSSDIKDKAIILSENVDERDSFVTFEHIDLYNWHVIKYTDGKMAMTKKTTLDNYSIDVKNYYYINVFGDGKVLGQVTYDRSEKSFWIAEGKDIESAVSVKEYILENDEDGNLYKEYYSKEDMKKIFTMIKKDYEKKIDDKDKVLVKEKSLY